MTQAVETGSYWRGVALALLVGIVLTPAARAAEPAGGRIVTSKRIWDRGKHNAFTDLIRYKGKWFCVFREGAGHVSPDGALRVLTSDDGLDWESAALIAMPDADLRDAKITTTPDNRLMLSGAAALPKTAAYKHQSLTWFSDDGVNWSQGHRVAEQDFWLWRTTWHGDRAYGVGYRTNNPPAEKRIARLYTSRDGIRFSTWVPTFFDVGYPNETSLVFLEDGTCYCLLRRDGKPNTGQLGIARPPYKKWQWKDLGTRIGGPHMIQLPDGRFVAAVRLYDKAVRTSLCWLDPDKGTLTEFLKLPSGGDTSYAGLVWHEDHLWVSYYSTHEKIDGRAKTAIYIAKVALD